MGIVDEKKRRARREKKSVGVNRAKIVLWVGGFYNMVTMVDTDMRV